MLFNSQIFLLVFLPLTVSLYWLFARWLPSGHPFFRILMLVASLAFYAYWDIRLLPLIFGSIAVNYVLIEVLARYRPAPPMVLYAGVTVNLALLAFFKYFDFFVGNVSAILGIEAERVSIVLPLAISFFTFEQISALVDVSKRQLHPHSLLDYALFVAFFPHLIAGPILRHDELVPQLQIMPKREDIAVNFAKGLLLLTLGLAKKVLIADNLSPIANPLFETSLSSTLPVLDAWTAVFAFGFQIYFDFSGYSDMALGMALLLGVNLPINFRSPYRSTSLIDFWRRWHITLSSFLRDYLYIPLGGSRHGPRTRTLALMTTMLLGGLWHGAGWNYVIWGGLHGIGLGINHIWRQTGVVMPKLGGWALTFIFVMITFLIFRAATATSIANLLTSLAIGGVGTGTAHADYGMNLAMIGLAAVVALAVEEPYQIVERQFWRNGYFAVAAAIALVFIAIYLGGSREQEFIYFQF
jgi:D-alanyl-lipoteichoic acid acyltransferase DltB (MBOAT superfamily)